MHRPDHGEVAWHDDPEGERLDPHRAGRRPAFPDTTRPDDGLRVVRHPDPEPAPRWRRAPDWESTRGGDAHRRLDQLPPPVVRDDRRPPPWAAGPERPVEGSHPHGDDAVAPGPAGDDPLPRGAGEVGRSAGAHEVAPPADLDVDDAAPPEHADGHAPPPRHEIEEPVPASVRLRAAGAQVAARVRRSVPLRTALFVLPPLVLPPALGLPLGASLVATLLLLWLAGAAALLATIMFDGSDQLALRSIDRRLRAIEASVGTPAPAGTTDGAAPARGRPSHDTEDALLAIGGQLDRLNDRLDELTTPRPDRPRPDDHRPAEQWSGQPQGEEDVGDAPGRGPRQWSDEGWQGRMR